MAPLHCSPPVNSSSAKSLGFKLKRGPDEDLWWRHAVSLLLSSYLIVGSANRCPISVFFISPILAHIAITFCVVCQTVIVVDIVLEWRFLYRISIRRSVRRAKKESDENNNMKIKSNKKFGFGLNWITKISGSKHCPFSHSSFCHHLCLSWLWWFSCAGKRKNVKKTQHQYLTYCNLLKIAFPYGDRSKVLDSHHCFTLWKFGSFIN